MTNQQVTSESAQCGQYYEHCQVDRMSPVEPTWIKIPSWRGSKITRHLMVQNLDKLQCSISQLQQGMLLNLINHTKNLTPNGHVTSPKCHTRQTNQLIFAQRNSQCLVNNPQPYSRQSMLCLATAKPQHTKMAGLLGLAMVLFSVTETTSQLTVNHRKQCGDTWCDEFQYCREIDQICSPCSVICDPKSHNLQEKACETHCQGKKHANTGWVDKNSCGVNLGTFQ